MPGRARAVTAPDLRSDRDPGELGLLTDMVVAEFIRHLARWGGTVLEEDGLLLFRGPHAHTNPFRNGALCLTTELEPAEVIARGQEFFGVRRSSSVLWPR